MRIREILKKRGVEASAPCRIDMGGTLDLKTFYLPLRNFRPCTVNMALRLRTLVRIEAGERGFLEIVSRGFRTRRFAAGRAPYNHSLGLICAIANYFAADGVRIVVESSSPPRSALGGSSSAAAALVAAFAKAMESDGAKPMTRKGIALLSHALEESVAGVPCGLQDHLAAVYGGVHAWHWPQGFGQPPFRGETLVPSRTFRSLERNVLVAYCGVPHESKDLNRRWVEQFLAGKHRRKWERICSCTQKFVDAVRELNYKEAARCMNEEVALRRAMTPGVLDAVGSKLAAAATACGCGARFTGAGGGGCVWALGPVEGIDRLRGMWENILGKRKGAVLLNSGIDRQGVTVHTTNHRFESKGSA